MATLCCDGHKCRMKNNCERYILRKKAHKDLVSRFYTFCNKKNDYKWIMLTKECKNKKYNEIYKKRKAT